MRTCFPNAFPGDADAASGNTGLGKADVTETGSWRRRQNGDTGGKEIRSQKQQLKYRQEDPQSVMVKGRSNHGHVTAALLLLGGLRAVGRGMRGENQAVAYNPDSVGCYLVDWAGVLIFLSLHFLN